MYSHIYCSTIHKAKIQNQLKFPSIDECVKNVVCAFMYTYTNGVLFNHKNDIVICKKWMKLEDIMLSEINPDTERQKPRLPC
jgi:hypothetical protein